MAEFQGKLYKIVVDIKVLDVVVENIPVCPPPKLIKVTKPSSGDSGYRSGYNLASVSVSYQPNPTFKRDCRKSAAAP